MTKQVSPKASTFLYAEAKDEAEKNAIKYFKEVCLRDGLEMRKELIRLIEHDWTVRHPRPGNPQKQIIQFDGSKSSLKMCEWEGCKRKAVWRCRSSYPYGKNRNYCSFHRKHAEYRRDICEAKKL